MRETGNILIEDANAMPAATWHNLRMNHTTVEIPAGLALQPHVQTSGQVAVASPSVFDDALAAQQQAWEAEHPAPTAEELAERAEFLAAEADATYGGTALSAYQANADAMEEARSLSVAFESGMGEEAAAFLRYAAGERLVVNAAEGETVEAQVVVSAADGVVSAAAVDVVAAARSTVTLTLVVDAGEDSTAFAAHAANNAQPTTFTGTTLRVLAGEDAHVTIVRTQAVGTHCADLDDMGLFAAQRASIQVTQTVLGGAQTLTGLATDLRGDEGNLAITTHYLGRNKQSHDFNYLVRHHGRKTECDLQANGVLAGNSSKTLRGTIDLIRGAKGAVGSENETVLLVDEGVHNKTIPIILCNEDDVMGNHGATIGHVRDEQMFYLASRGLTRAAAEGMFESALVEAAAIDAPSPEARRAVVRLGESVMPGFADLLEQEVAHD